MAPDMCTSDREFCARALACLKQALPGDEPDEADIVLSREHSPVLTNLNNGLLVAYLVDEADHLQYVQQRHLDGAGLTQAELHQQCIANLRALLKQKDIKVQPYGNVFAILCGGNFEASAVLVDGLWNSDPSDWIRRLVGDSAALANESLTAPLNVEMIEQEPGSR
jgi:hypothetical protein